VITGKTERSHQQGLESATRNPSDFRVSFVPWRFFYEWKRSVDPVMRILMVGFRVE
jgi:hypothetical protein